MEQQLSQETIDLALQRLFGLLPAHIRAVDAKNGRALEGLFRVLAQGDAELEAAIDALFDNQFIETADPDTLAHFAVMIGAPSLAPLPPGAEHNYRSFVANMVRYNRGKGTARTLEQVASDVTGFSSIAVEYFQRLAKLQHSLDFDLPRPGTADLESGEIAALVGRAFDALPRITDVRSIDRAGGRYHFDNVGVHVVRFAQQTWPKAVEQPGSAIVLPEDLSAAPEAAPWKPGGVSHPGYFQLAAQPGERLALFNPDRRDAGRFERPDTTDLADRLRRLPLHLETEGRRHAAIEGRAFENDNETWFGGDADPFTIYLRRNGETDFRAVPPAEVKIANFTKAPTPAGHRPDPTQAHNWTVSGIPAPIMKSGVHDIACAFDPVTGRLIVSKPKGGQQDVVEVRIAHTFARGALIGAGAYDRNGPEVAFDILDRPDLTNFIRIVDRLKAPSGAPADHRRIVQSLSEAIADWNAHGAGKAGWIVLTRCDRESPSGGASAFEVNLHPDAALTIVAAEWRENVKKPNGLIFDSKLAGFLVRRERRAILDAPVILQAASPPPSGGRAGSCTLDGIEIANGLQLRKNALERLYLRHCTVRAPGVNAIKSTAPLIGCEIQIDHSIIGRCRLNFGTGPARADLSINHTILLPDDAGEPVLMAKSCDTSMCGVTILGEAQLRSLEATNVIFSGKVTAVRRQSGCVRYSSLPPGSETPRRFQCLPDLAISDRAEEKGGALTSTERVSAILGAQPVFLDLEPDAPGLAMLHSQCADAMALGGEGESEMGAFALAATRLRLRNLTQLFDAFLPFGNRAAILDDTQSRISAEQGNRP